MHALDHKYVINTMYSDYVGHVHSATLATKIRYSRPQMRHGAQQCNLLFLCVSNDHCIPFLAQWQQEHKINV